MNTKFFFFIIIFTISLVGWVLNIVKLIGSETFSGEFIIRIIGIIVSPLGAIIGYF